MIHVTVEGTEALSAKLLALPETIRTRALASLAQIASTMAFLSRYTFSPRNRPC